MINLIVKKIMANIAQYTQLFDTETINTTCVTENNTITITGLNGEYVVSGAVDGTASKGCLNQMFNFVDGVVVTDCFFGDAQNTVDVVLHKVNVGKAVTRDFALEMMIDDKIDNVLIVYWESTQNTQTSYKYTISEDKHTMLQQKFGILFKLDTEQMQALGGCDVLDKIVANSVIETGDEDATLIRFDNVKDRFFAGKYYCVDVGFSYLEDMNINDIIKDRVKHFDTVLDTVQIND